MANLVRKLDDLIFNRRTISRANALNLATIERRAADVLLNDPPRGLICVRQITNNLLALNLLSQKGKRRRHRIAMLLLKARKIDRSSVSRGGVPVLSRVHCNPRVRRWPPKVFAAASPFLPHGYFCSPTWARPLRKVPVVTTTACAA